MKLIRCGISALVLVASTAAFAGDIYKCVDSNGKVSFSDTSCPTDVQQQTQTVQTAGQEVDNKQKGETGKSGQQPRGGYGAFIDRGREVEQRTKQPE